MTELALRGICGQTFSSLDFSTTGERKRIISGLLDFCLMGLGDMYLPGEGLFCHRRTQTEHGMKNEGASVRYTVITLLGLDKAQRCGFKVPFDLQGITKRLLDRAASFDSIGDLGLLLWFVAQAMPERIDMLTRRANIQRAMKQSREVQQGLTTELSWLLSGLTQVNKALCGEKKEVAGLAAEVYALTRANYGGRGIFRHMGKGTLSGEVRGRLGCFADQVYPIEAFSKFGLVFGKPEPVKIAQECAETICRLQGELGQWWWHYDARTGKVAGRYPVYSVHQDGMAPMALFALQEACKKNFDKEISKGLAWITGQNEFGVNLVDETNHVIWRNIHTGKIRKYADLLGAFLGNSTHKFPDNSELKILYECRPYHLGWLLYAFCGKYT